MEYGDLAFSMEPNQISEVITTEEGYVFFQLLEKIPAKKVTFADVSDRLQKMVIGQPKRILAPAYIRQLRREAAVGILDPKLRAEEAANESAAAKAEKALEEFRAKKGGGSQKMRDPRNRKLVHAFPEMFGLSLISRSTICPTLTAVWELIC